MVKQAFRLEGDKYLHWAGDLALNSKADVPWMMCKQDEAPGPIVSIISHTPKKTICSLFPNLYQIVCFLPF